MDNNNKIFELIANAKPTDIEYNKKSSILEKIDKKTIFWYLIIFSIILYIFSKFTIELNVIFGSIVGFILLSYLYNEHIVAQNKYNSMMDEKKKIIIPHPHEALKYENVVSFLFSIQDFYAYNPPAYEDMIEQIDYFFRLYEEINNDNSTAGKYYELLNNCRRQALNSLQSIIHNIPPNKELDDKLDNALNLLNILLQKYMNDVKKINDIYIYENGIKPNTKIINTGPVSINTFEDVEYSYDVF